jgi:hypothetical protein
MQAVMKGWLISASPGAQSGDSTPWFASFWEFCARYCNERFGEDWHLSPEQSLLLHAENTIIPSQAIIYSPKGHNNTVEAALSHVAVRPEGTAIAIAHRLGHPQRPATLFSCRSADSCAGVLFSFATRLKPKSCLRASAMHLNCSDLCWMEDTLPLPAAWLGLCVGSAARNRLAKFFRR